MRDTNIDGGRHTVISLTDFRARNGFHGDDFRKASTVYLESNDPGSFSDLGSFLRLRDASAAITVKAISV